jgi:hypothetical protein
MHGAEQHTRQPERHTRETRDSNSGLQQLAFHGGSPIPAGQHRDVTQGSVERHSRTTSRRPARAVPPRTARALRVGKTLDALQTALPGELLGDFKLIGRENIDSEKAL